MDTFRPVQYGNAKKYADLLDVAQWRIQRGAHGALAPLHVLLNLFNIL